MQTNVPAAAFSVAVDGQLVAISAVTVDANNRTKVTVTLAQAVVRGQQITLAYTDPTLNDDSLALQDDTGNDAANFYVTSEKVENLNPPTTPGTPDLISANDSGKSGNDNITQTNGMQVSVALPAGIAAGDNLVIALNDLNSTVVETIQLSALQVTSGLAVVTLPPLTHADLALANGYSFGLKARIEAPANTVQGTGASLFSAWSGTLQVVLDMVAPVAPLWSSVDSRSIATVNGFTSFYSKTSRPQLQGTAEAGSLIEVTANGVFLGTTTTLADGTWQFDSCLLYTSPSPRDGLLSRMPSSA